jgi:linoleoyl-CoA desaturase
LAIFLYLALLLFNYAAIGGVLMCVALGVVFAGIGFNVMHDANHGSFSSQKWVNDTLGLTANALGANAFFWKVKHNILHHTYTNITGIDDDIALSALLRQSPSQKWIPIHRMQHIYLPFAYSITVFVWVLVRDFVKYFSRKIYTTPIPRISPKEHCIFWISKLLYGIFYIAIPILCVGWLNWLIGFAIICLIEGFVLAIVFQLAHAVEITDFEEAGEEPKLLDCEWAVHQVRSTANFAPRNPFINWFVGGLNFQVEHHLFPRVSHIHYPAISNIVKKTCEKFNLPYHSFGTVSEAIVSHWRLMKKLGEKPNLA